MHNVIIEIFKCYHTNQFNYPLKNVCYTQIFFYSNLPCKTWPRTATIEVTLSNSGPDAFEFNARGPYLTIIRCNDQLLRCITRTSSTYYIKGSKEKREQISKRKLTEYLNQVKINVIFT